MTLPIVWELAKDKTLWNMSEYLNKIAKVLPYRAAKTVNA